MSTAASQPVTLRQRKSAELYRSDIHAWSVEQTAALRRHDFAAIDWDNITEEIDDVGGRHRDTWTSHCANIITHFLKIEHFREARSETVNYWLKEIRNQRALLSKQMRRTPSLKHDSAALFPSAWQDARSDAVKELSEMDVDNKLQPDFDTAFHRRNFTLPSQCPYQLEHVIALDLKRWDRTSQPSYSVYPPQIALVISEKLDRSHDPDLSR